MGLSDYLKCPGLDRTLSITPKDHYCPQCQNPVEIWSDEIKRRCPECGTVVLNPEPLTWSPETDDALPDPIASEQRDELIELALSLGCDGAVIIPATEIVIDPQLAGLCFETCCPNYGLSPTCPPNVEGPEWMNTYIKAVSYALFLNIQIAPYIMYSDQRREIGKLLHFIVIQIEKAAQNMGFKKSRAFAGGSCKNIFCSDHYLCEVLNGDGQCRNPDSARPSVSGYGIHINHLVAVAGWSPKGRKEEHPQMSGRRYGLITLAR